MTLIICKRIDCMYIKERTDKTYQCKGDAIGVGQDKKCDSYMQIPEDLRAKLSEHFDVADTVIQETYPDTANKGKGWWGESRVPNYGILRGAIASALASQQIIEINAKNCKFREIDPSSPFQTGDVRYFCKYTE